MKTIIRYCIFQLLLSVFLICSVIIFGKGFLLVKIPQNKVSTQKPLDLQNKNDKNCFIKHEDRVILMFIDALRFDFVVKSKTSKFQKHYENKMPILVDTKKKHPKNTRLYKFLADPPTTTMQRIKGITTGTLPTFSDAAFNFNSKEIIEDNIVDQMVNHGCSIVQMGDDTWTKMFPGRFKRFYPMTSFDVFDLDTVDLAINKSLKKELENTDWQLLIAHYLGIDHAGHKHGPNHPEMSRKLKEINAEIEYVINAMKNNETLMVLGDHGMTKRGDHSGDSSDEISSVLFIYSKKPLLNLVPETEMVQQIDFVPTFASFFNIPIPFCNLGSIILNFLPEHNFSLEVAKQLLNSNLNQSINYINEYQKTSKTILLENLKNDHKYLESNIKNVTENGEFLKAYANFVNLMRNNLTTFKNTWIKFNFKLIFVGILSFLITLIIFINNEIIFTKNLVIFNLCSFIIYYFVGDLITLLIFMYLINLTILFFINFKFKKCIDFTLKSFKKFNFVFLATLMCLFTTSFIIEESKILLFIINSTFLFYFYFFSIKNKYILLILLVLTRFSAVFWQCREDQLNCESNSFFIEYNNYFLIIICLLLLITRLIFFPKSASSVLKFLCYFSILMYFVSKNENFAIIFYIIGFLNVLLLVISPTNISKNLKIALHSNLFIFLLEIVELLVLLVVLLLGDYLLSIVSMGFSIFCILSSLKQKKKQDNSNEISNSTLILYFISSLYFFYGTGHQATFLNIPWKAAFVGMDRNFQNLFLPGTLILINLFSSILIHSLLLPLIVLIPLIENDGGNVIKGPNLQNNLMKKIFELNRNFIFFSALRVFSVMISCVLFRRHLMIWSVFTPKLIYECLSLFICIIASLFNYLIIGRFYFAVNYLK